MPCKRLLRLVPILVLFLLFPDVARSDVPDFRMGKRGSNVHLCGPNVIKLSKGETAQYVIGAGGNETYYLVLDESNPEKATISPKEIGSPLGGVIDGVFDIVADETGTNTITIYWNSIVFEEELADGFCQVKVRVASPDINSTGDAGDVAPGDGMCDTDGLIDRDGNEEMECTLRAAIMEANAIFGPDLYQYRIPVTDTGSEGGGKFRISPGGALPPVTDLLVLDGRAVLAKRSQAAQAPTASITIDGAGLVLGTGSDLSLITGHTIINAPGVGIQIDASDCAFESSFVGTTSAGDAASGNGGSGFLINGDRNVIGGSGVAQQNIIAGNAGYGVEIHGSENLIQGNWIGVGPNGATSIANVMGGIAILDGDGNEIGGETSAAGSAPGNVISGNAPAETSGIIIKTNENQVSGNLIGLDASGENALGNGGHGVEIVDAADNVIGDPDGDSGNRIAFNLLDGVRVSGASSGNAIVRNEIFENEELGIDLGGDGVTINEDGDADEGPNKLQNFPTITYRTSKDGQTRVDGFLSSAPGTTYRLDFFANDDADPSGFGEADHFLDHHDVSTDAEGRGEFSFQFEGVHDRVVATATDPDNNTSEISKEALMINTISDASDSASNDGRCNTGGQVGAQKECSLRAAIEESNRLPGPDFIGFDIPGTGPFFISAGTALPLVAKELTMDATTQAGYTPEFGSVELTGSGVSGSGLTITAPKATVRGLLIRDFGGDGIEFTGNGPLTVSHVQLKNNKRNGLSADADVVVEATEESEAPVLDASANDLNGILLTGGSKLTATGKIRANLNGAASTRPFCDNVAGITVSGTIDIADVEVDNNCGNGILNKDNFAPGVAIKIAGDVQITKNAGSGMNATGAVDITGGYVQIDENIADGIRTTASIMVTGVPGAKSVEGEGIHLKKNGLLALNAINNLTLSGKALVDGNGFEKGSNYPCFDNRYGAIVSQTGSVTTDAVTVKANCGSGIIAGNDITINGNAKVVDNGGNFGLWGGGNISVSGESHEISRNGESAIWSANEGRLPRTGVISVTGMLTAKGNGTEMSERECQASGVPGFEAAVSTQGRIDLGSIDISDNCYSGVYTLKGVTISGNARVKGNSGFGIGTGNPGLTISGAEHDISNNGRDGVSMFNRTGGVNQGLISGHLVMRNNNTYPREHDSDTCDEGTKYAAFYGRLAYLEFDRITIIGNCGDGVIGHSVRVSGVTKVNQNTDDGFQIINTLRMNTGQVCANEGYGIRTARVELGSVQVCENELGGIRGQILPAAGKSGFAEYGALSRIDGASIEDNFGDGISFDGVSLTVANTNISGNTGFGIFTASGSPVIAASGNWWGDATGPGGVGPGSGDGASPGVEAGAFLDSPVGLVASSAVDTLFVLPGESASVSFSLRNWLNENDALTVSIESADGWLQNPGSFPLQLSDTLVSVVSRDIQVPPGKRASMSYVMLNAVSTLDAAQTARDSVLVLTYEPALESITVEPDTLVLAKSESGTYTAIASDQGGLPFGIVLEWTADGGDIDPTGNFTAGRVPGFYQIEARDPVSGISGKAVAHIVGSVATEKAEVETDQYALHPAYPNPFVTVTTIPFQVKNSVHISIELYNIMGQRIRSIVDGVMPSGRHEIKLDRGELPTGLYIIKMEAGEFRETRTLTLIK